jgi:hypothetical protein
MNISQWADQTKVICEQPEINFLEKSFAKDVLDSFTLIVSVFYFWPYKKA